LQEDEKMHQHFKLYKPYSMLSQMGTAGYKKKRGLAELFPFPPGVQPVGRLDEDSEGLLLLTSDNVLNMHIREGKVEKEYWVQLDGAITAEALVELAEGVVITKDGAPYQTLPCKVRLMTEEPALPARYPPSRAGRHRPYSWISIVLTEGKHRQVRKMTAAVGFPTLRLVRVRIGQVELGDMQPGEVRSLPHFA
jgi:23S rRNA pseudouridine2457 synthase